MTQSTAVATNNVVANNVVNKTKVLWFSRHEMTPEQRASLGGDVEIIQIDRTVDSAFELKAEIDNCDIIAIVAPINLQQQFLKLAGDKPVITALSERIFVPDEEGGEKKVASQFKKWERLIKIEVVKEDFIP